MAALSSFAVEGPLSLRRLTRVGVLPIATNSELVTNSVVDISVNGDGIVESAMLIGECGLKGMDERALSAVRQFAFEPLPLPRANRNYSA